MISYTARFKPRRDKAVSKETVHALGLGRIAWH